MRHTEPTPPPSDIPPAVAAFVRWLEQQHDAGRLPKWPALRYWQVWRLRRGLGIRPEHFAEIVEAVRAAGVAIPEGLAEAALAANEARVRATAQQAAREREARLTGAQRIAHDRRKTPGAASTWLDGEVTRLYGTYGRFSREVGAKTTLTNILQRRRRPQAATLTRLRDALNAKRQDRGDPPLTMDELIRRLDFHAPTLPPRCPTCGVREVRGAGRCCRVCWPLQRMAARSLSEGGRLLIALLAKAAEIPAPTVAALLHRSPEQVARWADDPQRHTVVAEFRRRLRRGSTLRQAVAQTLDRSEAWVVQHLRLGAGRGEAESTDYKIAGQEVARIAALLSLTPAEYLSMFDRTLPSRDDANARLNKARRRRWHPSTGGRPPSARWCNLTKQVLGVRFDGKNFAQIARDLHLTDTSQAELPSSGAELRAGLLRHARACDRCRPRAAYYLSTVEGQTVRQVMQTLAMRGLGSAHTAIRRGQPLVNRMGVGLTIGAVATQARVSTKWVRRHADAGEIPFTRTPGGRRRFPPDAVTVIRQLRR